MTQEKKEKEAKALELICNSRLNERRDGQEKKNFVYEILKNAAKIIGTDNRLERQIFKNCLSKWKSYLIQLEEAGQIKLERESGRNTITEIILLQEVACEHDEIQKDDQAKPGDRNLDAFIFIDLPNLVNQQECISTNRINWPALCGALLHSQNHALNGQDMRVYGTAPKNMEGEWAVARRAKEGGFKVLLNRWQDIDSLMSVDISRVINENPDKKNIAIIIVSGDGVYEYPILKLRQDAKLFGTNLKVIVLSWRDNIHHQLKEIADEVRYIEEILEYVDFAGYRHYLSIKAPEEGTTSVRSLATHFNQQRN